MKTLRYDHFSHGWTFPTWLSNVQIHHVQNKTLDPPLKICFFHSISIYGDSSSLRPHFHLSINAVTCTSKIHPNWTTSHHSSGRCHRHVSPGLWQQPISQLLPELFPRVWTQHSSRTLLLKFKTDEVIPVLLGSYTAIMGAYMMSPY